MKLLQTLLKDEKNIDKDLYSSGPYWDYKNKRTVTELKKKGLKDFRGTSAGIGTSFTDNLVLDIRNELNIKGRLISSVLSLPLINRIFSSQISLTKGYMNSYLENLAIVYKNSLAVQKLIKKYKFLDTTKFGCINKFQYQDQEYSTHYLNMAHRVENLSNKFDFSKIKSYFEIGGGFEQIYIF